MQAFNIIQRRNGLAASASVSALVVMAAWLTVVTLASFSAHAQQKPMAKGAPAGKPAMKGPPRGPVEKYDCKIGTEDQHARIAILAQGGEVQSVAYYSKWKPRTCSVQVIRGDSYSTWEDTGTVTRVMMISEYSSGRRSAIRLTSLTPALRIRCLLRDRVTSISAYRMTSSA